MTTPDQAADLIIRHVDRELAGAVWQRARRAAEAGEVSLTFIRCAERRERIDQWRHRTGSRPDKGRINTRSFISIDEPEDQPAINRMDALIHDRTADLPHDRDLKVREIIERLMRFLPPDEQWVVHQCMLRDRPQIELTRELNVTEARISQLKRSAQRRMKRVSNSLFPNLGKELFG